jgi:adenylosuccinate lyase
LRNTGVPFSHSLIAFRSLVKGLNKLIVNIDQIETDLDKNWAVVSEAIQTVLRREGFANPYEILKDLTRVNKTIGRETIADFINHLEITEELKEELLKISPKNYTGI